MNRIPNDRRTALTSSTPAPGSQHTCPWCGSDKTEYFQRGYTGPTDESDQFYLCRACNKKTYELISRTTRQMRMGRYRTGGAFKDHVNQTEYRITRMLKVGFDEHLLHLKPVVPEDASDAADTLGPSGRH